MKTWLEAELGRSRHAAGSPRQFDMR